MTEQERKELLSRNGFKRYKVDVIFEDNYTKEKTNCHSTEIIAKNPKQAKEKVSNNFFETVKYWAGGDYKFKATEVK